MRGIKGEVLEWKRRPFGLKRMRKNNVRTAHCRCQRDSATLNLSGPVPSRESGEVAVAEDERRVVLVA